jgi:hypothetical protein
MKSNPIRWVLLALAGTVALVLTWFGLMDFAFTTHGRDNPIAVALIWILPLFSLPLVVTYSTWKRMRPAVFWGFVACQWATLAWLNFENCFRKGCTTSNPLLIALSAGIFLPVLCWLIIAGLCQLEHHLRPKVEVL